MGRIKTVILLYTVSYPRKRLDELHKNHIKCDLASILQQYSSILSIYSANMYTIENETEIMDAFARESVYVGYYLS